jgi:hypothetical protein
MIRMVALASKPGAGKAPPSTARLRQTRAQPLLPVSSGVRMFAEGAFQGKPKVIINGGEMRRGAS